MPTPEELRAEIAKLDAKLTASTGGGGKPLQGYRERCEAIAARTIAATAELKALLEAALGQDTTGG